MAEQRPPNNSTSEIEVGQLFKMMGKGIKNLSRGFLKFFLYLKRNAIVLLVLIIFGVAIAVVLNNFSSELYKTEVIVKPNYESNDYLYDVVEEITSNIATADTLFFEEIGIDVKNIEHLRIEIMPIENREEKSDNIENEIKYLQVLKDMPNDLFVQDILKSEILKKSVTTHRITFFYKEAKKGREQSQKIMGYINNNPYFNKLKEVYVTNASTKIEENKKLIEQVDELISGFAKRLGKKEERLNQGAVLLESESGLDVPTLLALKNSLIKENERKRLEIIQQNEVVKILNFGKSHQAERSFFEKRIVKFPLILLGFFFLYALITHLNRKSRELQS